MSNITVLDLLGEFKKQLGHLAVAGVEPHATLPRLNQDRDILFNIAYYLRVGESGQCFELQFTEQDLKNPIDQLMQEVIKLYETWIVSRNGVNLK